MDTKTLVKKGYKQAAFRRKSNLNAFRKGWAKKGYKTAVFSSSGPTVEGGYKRNAYYAIASKSKTKHRAKRRTSRGTYFMGVRVD